MRQVEKREDKRLRWQWQISFNRKETDMKSDITIIPSGNYHIPIKGLKQNDIIRIYGTSGILEPQVSWHFRNRQNLIQNCFAHQ